MIGMEKATKKSVWEGDPGFEDKEIEKVGKRRITLRETATSNRFISCALANVAQPHSEFHFRSH
jgi:hypothetical protein